MSLEKRKSGVLEQSPWTPRTPRERAGEASAGERLFRRVCLQPQDEAVEKLCAEQLARVAEEQQQTDALEAAMAASSTALAQLAAQGNPAQQKVLKERLLALKSLLRVETKAEWQRVRAQLEAERSRALDHAELMLQVEQQRVAERRAAEEAAVRRVGELLAEVRARRAAAERALKEREEKAAAHQQSRLQELRKQRQRLLEETNAMRRELTARHQALQAQCQAKTEAQTQTGTQTQAQIQPQTVAQPAHGMAEVGGGLRAAGDAATAAAGETGVEGGDGRNTAAVSDPARAANIAEFLQGWRLLEYHQSRDGMQMDFVLSVLKFVTLRVHIDLAASSFSLSPAINHSVVAEKFPLFEVAPAMETLVVGPSAAGPSQPHSSPLTAAALAAAYQ
ncbi:unnamed protein product, partial [Closterium sp. NIES-53]